MQNINFGKQGGFRHKGNFQPRQTGKQIRRAQRIEKRAVKEIAVAQKHGVSGSKNEISSFEIGTPRLSFDAILLATSLLTIRFKRRGF